MLAIRLYETFEHRIYPQLTKNRVNLHEAQIH